MFKRCAFVLLAIAACTELEVETTAEEVLNGTARRDASYPYQVEINGCQGTLISPHWVLSAGHCMRGYGGVFGGDVILERTDPVTGVLHRQESTASIIDGFGQFVHPDFRLCEGFCTSEHDIALLRLNTPFQINSLVSPARLPFAYPAQGTIASIASDIFHGQPRVPGYFSVFEAPIDEIGPGAPYFGDGGFALVDPDSSSCSGDSGSGVVTNDGGRTTVIGIASAGNDISCDDPDDSHTIATDVLLHTDFILDTFRATRWPNTSLQTAPAVCRSAPQRLALGQSRRRADVAEIWASSASPPAASFAVHPSSGFSFGVFEEWARNDGGIDPNSIRWSAGDFDGDGDQDLVAAWNDSNFTTLTLRRSSGASFSHEPWRIKQGAWTGSSVWLPGDFNNDGRTDLVEVKQDGTSSTFLLWRSTGSSFSAPTTMALRQGGWIANAKWNVADFNLDGRDDILASWQDGTATTFTVRTANADGTLTQAHWLARTGGWANNMQFLVGNFDANGGPDVMVMWNDAGMATATFYRNQGNSTFAPGVHWAPRAGGWHDSMRWRAGDFDANGRDEVLAIWNDSGMATMTMRRWESNGSSGLRFEDWAKQRVVWQPSTDWCIGTFDGQ